MAKTIKKNDLIRVIKESINEALRYDKDIFQILRAINIVMQVNTQLITETI